MELTEGVGESSSPPRTFGGFSYYEMKNDIYNRLVENGNEEVVCNPGFRELLDAHFNRLPHSYGLDVNMDRVEDVLLHQKILAQAKDPEKRPAFHVRFIETRVDGSDVQQSARVFSTSKCDNTDHEGGMLSNSSTSVSRKKDCEIDFEPCSKLEDLNLDVRNNAEDIEERNLTETIYGRHDAPHIPVHEIIFSTIDKPKLLSQDTDGLHKELEKAIAGSEGSLSGSLPHSAVLAATQPKLSAWEIDRRLLRIGERIASGSCGELYRGIYHDLDVSVKIIRSEQLNEALKVEFAQEVMILREVQHENVVRFIGACTRLPELCIVTEFMPGGSLYDFLHMHHNFLELSQLLKFVTDICKGMEYLHQKNIIHRDLKTANLLMDAENVVKVADFGVARFQCQGGVMTAETGTYRWMAPEVINHQAYDQKADVFSFAIVLWELTTAKVPYDNMTPLQAALGVRKGLRPELPENMHPRLLDLMQRCWDAVPSQRPSFSEIRVELEDILQEIQET
ncbi:Protein kinase domain-containing protein [Cinnamomum micranthum f. kanehirae]|uniref:non-specific serine/threonine protein kinase n=1 Tax=Cinnamomum micranthum f. kanehirae TaxID=337451 RepID=A0A3S3QL43_9MAGN|nr:Protein kinase domain-containing protein [Cinnamomum micranthum f. kanehirae]